MTDNDHTPRPVGSAALTPEREAEIRTYLDAQGPLCESCDPHVLLGALDATREALAAMTRERDAERKWSALWKTGARHYRELWSEAIERDCRHIEMNAQSRAYYAKEFAAANDVAEQRAAAAEAQVATLREALLKPDDDPHSMGGYVCRVCGWDVAPDISESHEPSCPLFSDPSGQWSAATAPQAESPTWPHVLRFAQAMERKLAENRHKGDREGWLRNDLQSLLNGVVEETDELYEAMTNGGTGTEVLYEAADVANMAMMTADAYAHRFGMTVQAPQTARGEAE